MTTRITADCYSRAGALLASLDGSYLRQWQPELNDCGTGKLVLQNDDADLLAVAYGSVIRFSLDATPRFSVLVEGKSEVTIAASEEVDEATTITGRGTLAILEEAVVEPALGTDRALFQDSRLFNFAAPDFDDSGWAAAVATTQWDEDTAGDPYVPPLSPPPYPTVWPDMTAQHVWDQDSSSNGVPAGDVYFRDAFTVASACAAEVWAAADDAYEVWLDGEKIITDAFDVGYLGQSKSVTVNLDAGTHYLAVLGRNLNALKAFVLWTVMELDQAGARVGVLTHSDTTALVSGYPADPPGFTPGAVIRILVEEAQARGAISEVVLDFDDDDDSGSTPWPVTGEIAVQVGTDLLSVVRQLAETYFDVTMSATGFTLSAYAALGTVTAVSLDPLVNLTELRHDGTV